MLTLLLAREQLRRDRGRGRAPPVRGGARAASACAGVRAFLPWAQRVGRQHGAACAAFFTRPCAVDVAYGHAWAGRVEPPLAVGEEEPLGAPVAQIRVAAAVGPTTAARGTRARKHEAAAATRPASMSSRVRSVTGDACGSDALGFAAGHGPDGRAFQPLLRLWLRRHRPEARPE